MLYKNDEYTKAADELTLVVHGGTTADGVVVEGLPLAPGRIADDYYSIYALSLTQTDHCPEAIPVMQLILTQIAEDQVAYYNATQGMDYCRTAAGTPARTPSTTETATP
jgi:hypothetical protein